MKFRKNLKTVSSATNATLVKITSGQYKEMHEIHLPPTWNTEGFGFLIEGLTPFAFASPSGNYEPEPVSATVETNNKQCTERAIRGLANEWVGHDRVFVNGDQLVWEELFPRVPAPYMDTLNNIPFLTFHLFSPEEYEYTAGEYIPITA